MLHLQRLKMRPSIIGCLLLFGLIFSKNVAAQTCCSGGVPLTGNLGLPETYAGNWQFSLNYDVNVLLTLKDGTNKLDDNSRKRLTHSALLQAAYTFSPKLSIEGFISYVRQEREIQQPNLPKNFVHTEGIGDAVILAKYKVLKPLRLGLGLKFPTGASDLVREDGIPLNADLQPGSGSWDLIFWAGFNKELSFRPSMAFFGTSTFRLTGKNHDYLGSRIYQFGNEFQVIAGIGDRLILGKLIIDPSLAFRFRKVAADNIDSEIVPSTGGSWVFINPGLTYNITQDFSTQVNAEFPMYGKVTGTQLSPTYRINAGVFFKFGRKKDLVKSNINAPASNF